MSAAICHSDAVRGWWLTLQFAARTEKVSTVDDVGHLHTFVFFSPTLYQLSYPHPLVYGIEVSKVV